MDLCAAAFIGFGLTAILVSMILNAFEVEVKVEDNDEETSTEKPKDKFQESLERIEQGIRGHDQAISELRETMAVVTAQRDNLLKTVKELSEALDSYKTECAGLEIELRRLRHQNRSAVYMFSDIMRTTSEAIDSIVEPRIQAEPQEDEYAEKASAPG